MSNDLKCAIVLTDVSRSVPAHDDSTKRVTLLDQINLQVPLGSLLHIVGPSGSGKTTLLRLLNRLDDADAGQIEILGKPISHWTPRQLRRQVIMLLQEPTLLGKTARQNFKLAFSFAGLEMPNDFEVQIEQAIHQAGAQMDWIDRQASQLSVGQRQRLVLARSLIVKPRILLLDEPTASLDMQTAGQMLDQLDEIRRSQQTTILMVTHRIDEAKRLGGNLLVLNAGKVAYHGDVAKYDWQTMEQADG